ncbi:MAG: methionyl-tRNA formyltransferase [Chitinophagales bacterium]|nr:methionyl-tRNA formyltransferase [Chitinophagales bacterium]
MGTPQFAVPCLDILVKNNYNVVAVITAPDRPAGRGLRLQASPVKEYALRRDIPVLQPEKLKDPGFIEKLKSFHADLQIVVAFRMLPEIVWKMPPRGTINLHASLLPDYRGAAPINRVIINGEKETGVTTFFLRHDIDTGNIIFQEKIEIDENDTAGTLHDKLMLAGAELILKTVHAVEQNNYREIPQTGNSDKIAPRIFREHCAINWDLEISHIRNFVRGLSPSPTAYTLVGEKTIKIFSVHIEKHVHDEKPGTWSTDHQSYFRFAAKDGFVYADELQMEGKKRMFVIEFLKGFRI